MIDLRPCPFCGAPAALQKIDRMEWWRVICSNNECGAEVWSRYADGHGMEHAVEKWNRRMDEKTPKEMLEENLARMREEDHDVNEESED